MNIPYPESIILLENSDLLTYVLVDCAHLEHKFYRDLRKENNIMFKSLFLNTPDESSVLAGPVLIALNPEKNKVFLSKLFAIEIESPSVVWFWSKETFDNLYNLFQSMLYAKLPDNRNVLCRFYDSRCLEDFLLFYKNKEISKQLQNINAWGFRDKDNYRYIESELT